LAKIAVELQRARVLQHGRGWSVTDVICTSGPRDRPFEESHSRVSIAIVIAGTFQYRSSGGRALMTPGSLLLGSPGQCFECGHEHGQGDRCLSFSFAPDFFETAAGAAPRFRTIRLPPLRDLSPVIARACAGLLGSPNVSWEELAVQLAAQTMLITGSNNDAPNSAIARVTQAVRAIERNLDSELTLTALAREAKLSLYHFLRTFEYVTGVTPHQYVRRIRLREAAARLLASPDNVLGIALDAGFGDISNFNRAFRGEFGVSPGTYRKSY